MVEGWSLRAGRWSTANRQPPTANRQPPTDIQGLLTFARFRAMTRPAGETWITLGAASALMGVSESTVRRWADSGEVRSYRTSGGHRRVLQEDLRHLVAAQAHGAAPSRDTDRISDIAIVRVKRQLNRRGQGHALPLEGFSPEARDRLRLLGRQLIDLFARFIASNAKGERFSE